MENNIEMIENILNTERRNRRGNREIRFEVNSNYYKAVSKLLSDYKRVLKENEELLQEKINNQRIIALAQNDMLSYQAGFEDGKNGRASAVQSIIENQQYYIFQKQIEKYKRHIEKLQKENEELKNQEATARRINELLVQRYSNSISLQKVKDRIRHYQELQDNYIKKYDEINEGLQAMINVLQELIEEREEK